MTEQYGMCRIDARQDTTAKNPAGCRASSCTEGRNGRLSLYRHGHTRISDKKLKMLTTLHNYFSQRSDGTTAAQRFFGHKPNDLFEHLLDNMPDLPRPAAKRSAN